MQPVRKFTSARERSTASVRVVLGEDFRIKMGSGYEVEGLIIRRINWVVGMQLSDHRMACEGART